MVKSPAFFSAPNEILGPEGSFNVYACSNDAIGAPGISWRENMTSKPSFDFVVTASMSASVNGHFVHAKAFGIPEEFSVGGIASISA
jgi:hypothetical protein